MNGDNFDWTRDNAGTSSFGTGPRNDHTYGTAAGNIILVLCFLLQNNNKIV